MMTRDAKSGLLLGFILIVAIVFAVNGLPKFLKDKIPACASATNPPSQIIIPNKSSEDLMIIAKNTARNMIASPEQQPVVLKIPDSAKAAPQQATPAPTAAATTEVPVAAQNVQQTSPAAAETPADHQVYTVKSKDTLATIAKQFYGKEEGNRIVNIKKIAEYNSLKSVNSIYQGQELKIPPIQKLAQTGDFVEVRNYQPGSEQKIRNTTELPKVAVAETPEKSEKPKARKSQRQYTIKEKDTLWTIASKNLGSGKRYSEILKANPDLNGNEPLKLGTVINLPD